MGYRVLAGIDYPPNKRAEIGDVIDDLAPQSIKWLLSAGIIEDNSKSPKAVEKEPEIIEETTPEPEIETPAVQPTPEVTDAEVDNDSEPQKVEEE